jgi:hypothetical protein
VRVDTIARARADRLFVHFISKKSGAKRPTEYLCKKKKKKIKRKKKKEKRKKKKER